MPVWWVTGATGFLGGHVLSQLVRLAEESDRVDADEPFRVVALARRDPPPGTWPDRVEFIRAELGDRDAVRRAGEFAAPDFVIHCAGRTPPAPDEELRLANLDATVELLAGLRAISRPIRLVMAGSAAELGPVEVGDLPVGEEHPCCPTDYYGRIKWEAAQAVLAEPPPIEPIVARIFNPIGPGLSENQAFGRFARELVDSKAEPLTLRVGNLDARRDFVDIRDVARAMILLAFQGRPRMIYHVGTGRSHTVGDGLNALILHSGRAVRLEIDASLGNPRGPRDSRADIRRIVDETGWRPGISWERSLRDLWIDAKARLSRRDEITS